MATGVTVSYNGNVIHQMPANGQFTMNTEGAYMEGDVEVVVDVPTGGGSELIHKTISANGVYDATDDEADGYDEVTVNVPNSYSASDEGKVVSSGALVAQSSQNIMQNGTYDTTLKNEVVVNVSGGGGVELMTEADWDALTMAQKQAKGLVAIQQANSGYQRGLLINGADYNPINEYLPQSNVNNVDCFATFDNFDSNELSWGVGNSPIILSANASEYNDEEAVYLNARSGLQSYIELPDTSCDFTVYVVAKGIAYNNGDVIIMGSVNAWSNSNLIMLYHRSGTVWRSSIYGSDTDLLDTGGDYVAIAIRSSSLKASWFAFNANPRKDVSYNSHGNSFTFGYRSGVSSTDLAVKFVGYVNEAETDADIVANLTNLANVFNLS